MNGGAARGGPPLYDGDGDGGTGSSDASLQVIVLGSGGGPVESNTTSFLVRSTAGGWRRGSIVALDAGVHLGAITRILEDTLPHGLGKSDSLPLPHTIAAGPFAGLEVPYSSVSANAAHIQSTLIDTYLITHPHLDHIAGFVVNTAGLPGTRPKRLAGLPSTIAAFKTHIFNNVIWPNLSDENNGAGLVTYMRLVEGGSPALGDGDGRGYLEISDGLAVKIWGVSHGHCIERHSHRGSGTSTRYGSLDAGSMGGPLAMGMGMGAGPVGLLSPRIVAQHNATSAYQQQQQHQQQAAVRDGSILPGSSAPSGGSGGGGGVPGGRASLSMGGANAPSPSESFCVYDSSAYFIRDVVTGREVLMFGDVEPDSISLMPRNCQVWAEAGPKVAAGKLAAVFIECSYDDSQSVDRLFGHLTPRYIMEEMTNLAGEVMAARAAKAQAAAAAAAAGKKRKRQGSAADGTSAILPPGRRKTSGRHSSGTAGDGGLPGGGGGSGAPDDPVSPKTVKPPRVSSSGPVPGPVGDMVVCDSPHIATPTAELTLRDVELLSQLSDAPLPTEPDESEAGGAHGSDLPLRGLTVVIIHIKEKLRDGPSADETILEELLAHEEAAQLGCEFVIARPGQSLIF